MDSARVAAAVRQIMGETTRREPRPGRHVLMLAWVEDEKNELPRNPGDYDIISMTAPLGALSGDAACPDADRKVFLAHYFMTERFVQSLMPIADEDSPLFRMLTTAATKRHPVRRVNTPDPNKDLMVDLFAAAAVAYVERHDGWEQLAEALGVAIAALVSPVMPEEGPKGADEVLAVILQDIAARPERASLSALARRYSYSTTYLSELIHERCEKTFTELVTEQRMERAAMLLRATQLRAGRVAEGRRKITYFGFLKASVQQGVLGLSANQSTLIPGVANQMSLHARQAAVTNLVDTVRCGIEVVRVHDGDYRAPAAQVREVRAEPR